MSTLQTLYGTYSTAKFWIISTVISIGSALLLANAGDGLNEPTTPANSLILALVFAIATVGLCLLPFAIWQHIVRKRFFAWLQHEWSHIEEGAKHPDGYTITLDSELVRYTVVFSAFLATVSFSSKPYVLNHRSAGVAQASFTLFTLIFGWWFFGLEGVVETVKAVAGNIRSSDTFTLRTLLSQGETS